MEEISDKLRISITSYCNMNCIYCHNEGNLQNAILTKEQIKKIIDECKELNIKSVRITGGEPLISPEIEDICKMLSEDYKINVEINTNGIEIEKLLRIINKGWIKKAIVGIDYYDKKISKNSLRGESSQKIKENILKIKKSDCEVCIDTVYDGDDLNIENMVKWALDNDIEIRVIEQVSKEIDKEYVNKYISIQKGIIAKLNLDWKIDLETQEYIGYKNNKPLIKFYHSLCRMGLCEACKRMQLRITSNGVLRPCILNSNEDVNIFEGCIYEKLNLKMNLEKLERMKIKLLKQEMQEI